MFLKSMAKSPKMIKEHVSHEDSLSKLGVLSLEKRRLKRGSISMCNCGWEKNG